MHNVHSLINVLCHNSSSKTIVTVVCSLNDLIKVLKTNNLLDWAENLFSCNSHVILDISKYSWCNKISLLTNLCTASDKFRTFFLATVDHFKNLGQLLLVNLWSLFNIQIKRIANSTFLSSLPSCFHKFVINVILDKGTGTSTTTLTHVEEKTKMSCFNSLSKINIS